MPTREQIIRQALTLARKRLANGGSLSDEEYLNRYGGGWEDLPGITQPFPEEERTTTPSPGLPTATTPSTYSPPSYSAPSSRAPAPVQDFDEPSAPSAPSPSSAPSSFGLPSYSVTPGPQIDEGRVGPTDTFGSMVGLRAAVDPTPTITEMTTDFTLSPTLGRSSVAPQDPTDVETQEGISSQPSSPGPFGNLAGTQSTSQQSVGPYSFGEATQTSYGSPNAPSFGAGITPSGPPSPSFEDQPANVVGPGFSPFSPVSTEEGPGRSAAPPSEAPTSSLPGQSKFDAIMDSLLDAALAGRQSVEPGIGDIKGGHQFPDVQGQPLQPEDYKFDVTQTDLPAPSAEENAANVEGIYGGPSDANVGDDNGPAGYGGYGGYGGPSDAGIGDDNGAPGGVGSYGGLSDAGIGDDNGPAGFGGLSDAGIGDDNGASSGVGSYGGYGGLSDAGIGDDNGAPGGYGGGPEGSGAEGGGTEGGGTEGGGTEGGGTEGGGTEGGGGDGGGGDGGGGDGGGGDGGGEKRGGRILKTRPDVSKALGVARKYAKKPDTVRLARNELLEDRFPTKYLPDVGRQVMAGGGNADKDSNSAVVKEALVILSKKGLTPSKSKKRRHGGRPAWR